MRAAGGLAVFCLVAACAPLPLAEAERRCRAEIAAPGVHVGGAARLGASFGPGGARLERRLDLDLTVVTGAGGSAAAWPRCVERHAGRPPSRPFGG
jgi:hypothetical protein